MLTGASVALKWQEGDETCRALDGFDNRSAVDYPHARYLSQKFVEELCSATGMSDELLLEIEKVIFEAHSFAERSGAVDFQELRELRTARLHEARSLEEGALANISERIGEELEKKNLVEGLQKHINEKGRLIQGYTKDQSKLIAKGSEACIKRLSELTGAANNVRGNLRFFAAKEQSLLAVKDEVANLRGHAAPEILRKMAERNQASALKPQEWEAFLLDYKGDVDGTIAEHLAGARRGAAYWKGTPPAVEDSSAPLIADDAELGRQPLALLEAEIARVGALVSADRDAVTKFKALSKRLMEETTALVRLTEKLADCEGAEERARALVQEREAAYRDVFDAIVDEEDVLRELYRPLMARLGAAGGTMKKLSFSVQRVADVAQWAANGEELLDLRRQGPFRGKGALQHVAEVSLRKVWETGSPRVVADAMVAFRSQYQEDLLKHSQIEKSKQPEYREWSKRFARWLYGTAHIRIEYSIDYDGVDIRKLSPGTRGIVLLLLYLALDDADDRPLIIDQPEENLDPKSIFDELVDLFVQAKGKRQVIMITHNANLVVNTDADQIIIAQAGPHSPGHLPAISYLSGGLESAHIRRAVCDILEGGERAFRERARRLRVLLDR